MWSSLPDSVTGMAVEVEKLTNNKGFTNDPAQVTVTTDVLWAPSGSELWGQDESLDGFWFSGMETRPNKAWAKLMLPLEGPQYELFSRSGETWRRRGGWTAGMAALPSGARPAGAQGGCYLRSPVAYNSGTTLVVTSTGAPGYCYAKTVQALCVGFCI